MSSFLRPEAKAAVLRWREVLLALTAVALGVYFTTQAAPALKGFGYVLVLAGLGYVIVGWRRMRFRGRGTAPGAISITEGQITYFGPLTGGAVARSLLTRVDLTGAPHHRWWRLYSESGETLEIPHDAAGSEALFDLFASLPGASPDHLLKALASKVDGVQTVWQRDPSDRLTLPRAKHSPLH